MLTAAVAGEDRVGAAAQVQELRRKAEEQQGLAARAESAMKEATAKAEMHTQVGSEHRCSTRISR